jgi:hypothetical protein
MCRIFANMELYNAKVRKEVNLCNWSICKLMKNIISLGFYLFFVTELKILIPCLFAMLFITQPGNLCPCYRWEEEGMRETQI